jgi:hypothetical protein
MSFKVGDKVVSLKNSDYMDLRLGKIYVIEKIFNVTFPDGVEQSYLICNGNSYDYHTKYFREATEMDLALEGL